MLLPFSIRVAECPPVWARAIHSVNCTCLSWALVKCCVCHSFPFGIESGMWDVIVLVPEHCLSTYFTLRNENLQMTFGVSRHITFKEIIDKTFMKTTNNR